MAKGRDSRNKEVKKPKKKKTKGVKPSDKQEPKK